MEVAFLTSLGLRATHPPYRIAGRILRLVIAMAALANYTRALADEAPIFAGPFDDLGVLSASSIALLITNLRRAAFSDGLSHCPLMLRARSL